MNIEQFEDQVRGQLVKAHAMSKAQASSLVRSNGDLVTMACSKGRKPADVAKALASKGQ
jgi:hypothetical protein